MNLGLSNELKEAFSDILPAPTPLSPIDQEIKDPNWVAGFATGEACFFIGVTKNPRIGVGTQIQLRLYISQHSRDANGKLSKIFRLWLLCCKTICIR